MGAMGRCAVGHGQEPPCGESTTTECGFNYQLFAVITEVAQCGTPSCNQRLLVAMCAIGQCAMGRGAMVWCAVAVPCSLTL